MEKKVYENPELQVTEFAVEDVMTTSNPGNSNCQWEGEDA